MVQASGFLCPLNDLLQPWFCSMVSSCWLLGIFYSLAGWGLSQQLKTGLLMGYQTGGGLGLLLHQYVIAWDPNPLARNNTNIISACSDKSACHPRLVRWYGLNVLVADNQPWRQGPDCHVCLGLSDLRFPTKCMSLPLLVWFQLSTFPLLPNFFYEIEPMVLDGPGPDL